MSDAPTVPIGSLRASPSVPTEPVTLLPCPFCGSGAVFVRADDEDGPFVAVECTGCGCGSGKHYPLMDRADGNAAGQWNTRALRQEPSVEGLLSFVDEMLHGYGVNHTSKFVRDKAQAIHAMYRRGEP